MFYATTRDETNSFTLEKKSILVFERVVMNIGGHYNNIDGIFVAPKTGIYLFSWTVCTEGAHYVLTELMVDNTMISRAGEYEGNGNNYDCGSMVWAHQASFTQPLLLKCLYQVRRVRGHIFVCY
jgi:hypothetical protein